MKKIISFLVFTFFISVTAVAQDETPDYGTQLGLISYLTTVKALSEHQMTTLAANPAYKTQTEKASGFRSEYNLLKMSVDKLINQMAADMTLKNRTKVYKKLNKFAKGGITKLPANLSAYEKLISDIDGQFKSFLMRHYSGRASGASFADITGAVELAHTAFAGAREHREKKVQTLISQLEKLKLEKLVDLTETKKKD